MAVSLGPVPIHRSLLAAVESAARITPPTRSTLPSATSLCGRCDSLRPWLGRFLRPSRRAVSTLPSSRAPTLLSRTPHRGPAGPVRISPVRTFLSSSPVIRDYVDLPPNYDDATGLPFRSRDLDEREVLGIFGPGISAASANRLLRILHGRRVAGTLDDPLVQVNTMPYTKQQQDAALAYLRARVPVDEVINAGLRAEDELRRPRATSRMRRRPLTRAGFGSTSRRKGRAGRKRRARRRR
ncbi:hypothetical protein VTK73DRAFT_2071 [Phialemonium thermophilum]|uniref:Uncharacterized protein n=1 Tax=Phialemonium thermophilum TaxID=223376 RepID=A0ABR3VSK6_9PEZI